MSVFTPVRLCPGVKEEHVFVVFFQHKDHGISYLEVSLFFFYKGNHPIFREREGPASREGHLRTLYLDMQRQGQHQFFEREREGPA